MRNTLMNENMFANESVPVKVAARVYGKGNVNEQKRYAMNVPLFIGFL